jgi:hypothetical protein
MTLTRVLSFIAVLALACVGAYGDVIIEAVDDLNTTDVPSPGDLGTLNSPGSPFGDTGTGAGGTNAKVGDDDTGGLNRMAVAEFDISGVRTEIANASKIVLEFEVYDPDGVAGGPLFTIEGYAFDTNAGENGDIDTDDDTVSAVLLSETYDASTLGVGDTISFVVTTWVKADGADNGNLYSGFRLQPDFSGAAAANLTNGAEDTIRFGEARLIIIPEPTTMVLLGLGGLMGLTRIIRRRR